MQGSDFLRTSHAKLPFLLLYSRCRWHQFPQKWSFCKGHPHKIEKYTIWCTPTWKFNVFLFSSPLPCKITLFEEKARHFINLLKIRKRASFDRGLRFLSFSFFSYWNQNRIILTSKSVSDVLFFVLSQFLGGLLSASETAKVRFLWQGSSKMTPRWSVQGCCKKALKKGCPFFWRSKKRSWKNFWQIFRTPRWRLKQLSGHWLRNYTKNYTYLTEISNFLLQLVLLKLRSLNRISLQIKQNLCRAELE